MIDDDALVIPFVPPDADLTYRNYLETCRRAGFEPVPCERALGLIQGWDEAFAGRRIAPSPTQ